MTQVFLLANVPPKTTVILVDNDPDVRNLLAGVLKLKNMEVFKAESAEQCLEILNGKQGEIDCLVLNGDVAKDRGAMLIVNVKRINPKIVILVIADEDSAKTRILDYGADEFTLKPMSTENVADKVFNLIATGKREIGMR